MPAFLSGFEEHFKMLQSAKHLRNILGHDFEPKNRPAHVERNLEYLKYITTELNALRLKSTSFSTDQLTEYQLLNCASAHIVSYYFTRIRSDLLSGLDLFIQILETGAGGVD